MRVSSIAVRRRASFGILCAFVAVLILIPGSRSVAAANEPRATASNLLAARLETGEFGPAGDGGRTIGDLKQRSSYLTQVADAQRSSGELHAAEATASQIPIPEQRAQRRGESIREGALMGGGVQADFNSLMSLIQSTVQPDSWEELSG